MFGKKINIFISDNYNDIIQLHDYLLESNLTDNGVRVKIEQLSDGRHAFFMLKAKEKWYEDIISAALIYINENRGKFTDLYISSRDQTRMQSVNSISTNALPEDIGVCRG